MIGCFLTQTPIAFLPETLHLVRAQKKSKLAGLRVPWSSLFLTLSHLQAGRGEDLHEEGGGGHPDQGKGQHRPGLDVPFATDRTLKVSERFPYTLLQTRDRVAVPLLSIDKRPFNIFTTLFCQFSLCIFF